MAFAFLEDLVSAVFVFILNIENGIDEVLALQRPEAILPAETGEHRAVVKGGLTVQVKLCGPPGGRPVFKLGPVGVEAVTAPLGANSGEILDLKVAGLFQIVIVGHKIRAFLSNGRGSRAKGK